MQVFVEDWSAKYGSPYLVRTDDEGNLPNSELVEDGPEMLSHRGTSPTPSLAFVDGIRRLEASLYLSDGEAMAHGVAGSHACGAVLGDGPERMTFDRVRVTRLAIFGAEMTATLPSTGGFAWRSSSVADGNPEAPMNELQTRMREAEGILAEELATAGRLVIVDGPLHFVRSRDLPVVGHIKTHYRTLLDLSAHRRVPELHAGERTSLFRLVLVPNQVIDGVRARILRLLVFSHSRRKGPSCHMLMPVSLPEAGRSWLDRSPPAGR